MNSLIPVKSIDEINQQFNARKPMLESVLTEFKYELNKFIGKSSDTNSIMEFIYKYVDKAMSIVSPMAVCKKGCSNCCKLNVSVSVMEAHYIESKTGRKYNRKASELKRSKVEKSSKKFLSNCPFLDLDTRSCTIYEYRPLSCRMFMTFDSADFCKTLGSTHAIFTTESIPVFTQILIDLLQQTLKYNKTNFMISEIRELFTRVKG